MRTLPIEGVELPLAGRLSFGFQRSQTHVHNGIDLPSPVGTPVRAAHSGYVQYATREWRQGFSGYGRVVVIANEDGTFSLYAHLDSASVEAGEPVTEGETIGFVGTTEFASDDHTSHVGGAHLHFEVSANPYPQQSAAARLDPVAWLRGEGDITRPIVRPFPVAAADAPRSPSPSQAPHSSGQCRSDGGDDET